MKKEKNFSRTRWRFQARLNTIVFFVLLGIVATPVLSLSFSAGASSSNSVLSADAVLAQLIEGNQRYVKGRLSHPNQTLDRIHEVAKEQHPIAVILGCADSRVPPEILFDQGIGNLFVIREAGNIVDDAVLASMEYAIEHLGVSLIIVLGHERCGAVEAALHGTYHGHIGTLIDAISPAVERVKGKQGDLTDLVVRANVENVVNRLIHAKPILDKKITEGKLKVVGGYYDLDTGKVDLIAR